MTDDLSIPSFLDRTGDKPSEELRGWRNFPVHPAAKLFPMMSEPELRELGEDIKARKGLMSPIILVEEEGRMLLLDGRNRLAAMELVGILDWAGLFAGGNAVQTIPDGLDPYEYVLSVNLHRRHLDAEEKRDLIAKVLKAKPEASDRQIAKQTKTSPTTVGKIRKESEASGDVSKLDTRNDTKGRKQPASKPARKKKATPDSSLDKLFEGAVPGRVTESAEVNEPAARVDEVDRRIRCVTNTILRHVDGLSYGDAADFFDALRDWLDENDYKILRQRPVNKTQEAAT
jgi:hypothetical protein